MRDAVWVLELESAEEPVDDAMIDDRFETFGGAALQCLDGDESLVTEQKSALESTVRRMEEVDKLKRFV